MNAHQQTFQSFTRTSNTNNNLMSAESLLNFDQPLDVQLLDNTIDIVFGSVNNQNEVFSSFTFHFNLYSHFIYHPEKYGRNDCKEIPRASRCMAKS